jgi:nicotinate-nucleotide adenylyltransferase
MDKQRYGIFGGTFDPIHHGHLIAAQVALEILNLDRILFLPSANPPHKESNAVTPFQLREQMVQLAIQDNPQFLVSDLEARRGGLSYTISTITELRKVYPLEEYDLWLMIGADNLVEFNNWKEPEKILQEIPVVVLARPGYELSSAPPIFRQKARWVQIPLIDISSTGIRQRIAKQLPIRYLVPENVENFIYRHKLYQYILSACCNHKRTN